MAFFIGEQMSLSFSKKSISDKYNSVIDVARERLSLVGKDLVWSSGRKAGSIAGGVSNKGYLQVNIGGVKYMAHRLALAIHNGFDSGMEIDHIDGDKRNNSIDNLRESDRSENNMNQVLRSDNKSGIKGVDRRESGRYRAQIQHRGVKVYLGNFESERDAENAVMNARRKFHGEFYCDGNR